MGKMVVPAIEVDMVTVEFPFGEINPQEYLGRSCHVNLLSTSQAKALRGVFNGARKANLTLESGRPVASPSDAVRLILETIAKG